MPRHMLFPTLIYETGLTGARALNPALIREALSLAEEDSAGRHWSSRHYPGGYTSYAALDDLDRRSPTFAALRAAIEAHLGPFCRSAGFAVRPKALRLNGLWVNVLESGGTHSGHIHPLSVVSGTYYVQVPRGAGGIRFEDPRLPLMMAAPPRRASAPAARQTSWTLKPRAGQLVMWESWLRHEVLAGRHDRPRISVSFNVGWA